MRSRLRSALPLLLVLLPSRLLAFGGTLSPDSTSIDRWRLGNGLDVVAHHLPGARFVASTLAFRAGTGYEPADRPGSAQLLATAWFLAGAGATPTRAMEDLQSLRPNGWDFRVNRECAVFCEVTTPSGLAGVLAEQAERLKRPLVGELTLRRARAATARLASERYFLDPAQVLHYRVRALAEGVPDERMVGMADEKAMARMRLAEVTARLAKLYVPANATLTIAGDLDAVDVHAMVGALLSDIPAGERQPRIEPAPLRAGARTSRAQAVSQPACALGMFAPALDDSSHASFLVNMLLIGSAFQQSWGAPAVGRTRFAFSVLDEPDLVRFYPPLPPGGAPADGVRAFELRLAELEMLRVTPVDLEIAREHFRWLLGGPMSPPLLDRMRQDPGSIAQLGINEALRTLGRGPEFWERYLLRFDLDERDQRSWMPWLRDATHRAVLVLQPSR